LNITLYRAQTIISAAERLAAQRGVTAALAVVDTGGNLVAFARMDGANLITIDTAIGKAFTAISMGIDTLHLAPIIQPGQPLFGTGLALAQSRSLVPYAGGVVIRNGDAMVGALGVSGAPTSETDHEIGLAATQQL
jgi:uncharacterized protein GlcG (DUF336 family)